MIFTAQRICTKDFLANHPRLLMCCVGYHVECYIESIYSSICAYQNAMWPRDLLSVQSGSEIDIATYITEKTGRPAIGKIPKVT